ncbi:MAG: DUF5367 family protein [Candidatus Acidiferrales bacterium]
MHTRLFRFGLAIWLTATIALRLAGQHLFHPGHWKGTLLLFAISFPLMAWVARRLCQAAQLSREQWVAGAASLALPSLLCDPFSCAFFPAVFPNMAPEVAGVFGGWVLWCCGGAIVGAMIGEWRKA